MIKKKKYSDSVSYKVYSKDVNKHKVMTTKREREIKALMLDPNTTEEEKTKLKYEIVEGHLKYVLQFANKLSGLGLEVEDLIAEGNVGLMIAINSFDWTRGTKFITHAGQWIRHEMMDALYNHSKTIRLPVNIAQQLHREIKAQNEGKKEMSDEMNNLPSTTDLHKVIGEDSVLADLLRDKNAVDPSYDFEYNNLIEYVLSKLDERSAKVVSLLYGLEGKEMEIQDIADQLDLHKATVYNIRNAALEKISKRFLPSLK